MLVAVKIHTQADSKEGLSLLPVLPCCLVLIGAHYMYVVLVYEKIIVA